MTTTSFDLARSATGAQERPARSKLPAGQPSGALALQRLVGNRATGAILSRRPSATPAFDPAAHHETAIEVSPDGASLVAKVDGIAIAKVSVADPDAARGRLTVTADPSGVTVTVRHDGSAELTVLGDPAKALGLPVRINEIATGASRAVGVPVATESHPSPAYGANHAGPAPAAGDATDAQKSRPPGTNPDGSTDWLWVAKETLRQINPFSSHEERVKAVNEALARNADALKKAGLPTDNGEQLLAPWGALGDLAGGWIAGKAFGPVFDRLLVPKPVPGVRSVKLGEPTTAALPPSEPTTPAPEPSGATSAASKPIAPPAPDPVDDRLFTEEEIDAALSGFDDKLKPIGKGLRRLRPRLDIDEPTAVANKGAWDSSANKRFLESTTNELTKNDLSEVAPRLAPTRFSLRDAEKAGPDAFRDAARRMMNSRFSEVEELDAITNKARQAMRKTNRPVDKLRDAINKSIRRRIATSNDPDAVLVRRALRAVGIDPKGLRAVR